MRDARQQQAHISFASVASIEQRACPTVRTGCGPMVASPWLGLSSVHVRQSGPGVALCNWSCPRVPADGIEDSVCRVSNHAYPVTCEAKCSTCTCYNKTRGLREPVADARAKRARGRCPTRGCLLQYSRCNSTGRGPSRRPCRRTWRIPRWLRMEARLAVHARGSFCNPF